VIVIVDVLDHMLSAPMLKSSQSRSNKAKARVACGIQISFKQLGTGFGLRVRTERGLRRWLGYLKHWSMSMRRSSSTYSVFSLPIRICTSDWCVCWLQLFV